MVINDLETAWPIWRVWRATGRRFLPSQLLAEPQWLLDDILAIDAGYIMYEDEMKRQKPQAARNTDQ